MSDTLSPEEAAALERALAPLRDAFRAKLGGRLAELEAQARGGDAVGLHRTAHTLFGTAGSYGFSAVAAAARRIEEITEPARQDGSASPTPELEAALDALRAAVAAAAPGRPLR